MAVFTVSYLKVKCCFCVADFLADVEFNYHEMKPAI